MTRSMNGLNYSVMIPKNKFTYYLFDSDINDVYYLYGAAYCYKLPVKRLHHIVRSILPGIERVVAGSNNRWNSPS
jgi:hypothetical protein